MKKTIRILSIVSLIMAAVCMALVIGCICGQRLLMPLFNSMEETLGRFYVPVSAILSASDIVLCAVLLMVGTRIKGIAFEIIVPVLRLFTPGVVSLVSIWQTVYVGNRMGAVYLAGLSAVNQICSFSLAVGSLATVLMLLACGMSIAYKRKK